MCMGGPKVVQQPTAATPPPKPVVYMRNQWLDGLGINAEQRGRNSLRIDRTSGATPGLVTPRIPSSGLGIGVN